MALVNIVNVRTRALELLLASPDAARYTDAIGTNSEYAVKQEITDAILATDFDICGAIIDLAESGSGAGFMFPSGSLVTGAFIPSHEGSRGNVELFDGSAWVDGLLASSEDEIAEMLASPTLYANAGLWYFIKFRQIRHNASLARVYLPTITKTAACQAHERYENAELWGAVMTLEKDGSDQSFFRKYETLYMTERQRLLSSVGVITKEIPDARERAA